MTVARKTKPDSAEPDSAKPAGAQPAGTPAGAQPAGTPAGAQRAAVKPTAPQQGAQRPADPKRSVERSARRDDVVRLAGELFAQKGYRATTVREIADAAGILSGSLYHHFDSKESIGDEILARFLNEILADYRAAVASDGNPRFVIEQIVRSTSTTLTKNQAALAMLLNDWNYFRAQPRFGYLTKAVHEIEQTWISQLRRGVSDGTFRADLDPALTYRLLRDVLWIPAVWRQSAGYTIDQIVDAFLRLLFDGIMAPAAS